ncbi:hypothetical protein EI94DRAFT_1209897 [Lactarius quietus]|nr:hypothetical protein EI94DRAFT_1209897 [Lactarius quietus]
MRSRTRSPVSLRGLHQGHHRTRLLRHLLQYLPAIGGLYSQIYSSTTGMSRPDCRSCMRCLRGGMRPYPQVCLASHQFHLPYPAARPAGSLSWGSVPTIQFSMLREFRSPNMQMETCCSACGDLQRHVTSAIHALTSPSQSQRISFLMRMALSHSIQKFYVGV